MADKKIEKKLIRAPSLPDTVQGDGRYLMRLLKKYLEDQAVQLNLANGFTADEIKETDPNAKYIPRHFTLTFDRLGGHFTWDPPSDVSKLAYYELRTDTNVGSKKNVLATNIKDRYSNVLPTSSAGTVYLYAINSDKTYSGPTTLNYNKQRPFAPQDLALTKNNEGTLITFLDIPSSCIGAYVYVDGVKFDTLDNVFLYTNENEDYKIREVKVAYYDSFGEGDPAVLLCTLPDVTGFLVERNGANLDFYWNPINIYNVSYEVRVSVTPVWTDGRVLFTTKTNDKNRYIYPNEGEYYLLVKAKDAHGNYSENAAYQLMNTEVDISRNVILSINQGDDPIFYSGAKINMYYDVEANNIVLDREAVFGEYVMDIQLPQQYRARNWLSFDCYAYSTDALSWDDATFAWDEATGALNGAIIDNSLTEIEQKIAFYVGESTLDTFLARENEDVTPETGGVVLEEQNADEFESAHYGSGVKITPTTRLAYTVEEIPEVFSFVFSIKLAEKMQDTVFMVLEDDGDYIRVGYDAMRDMLYLVGSDGAEMTIPGSIIGKGAIDIVEEVEVEQNGNTVTQEVVVGTKIIHKDWLTFGISQGTAKRRFFVNSLVKQTTIMREADAVPICEFAEVYCYPKF